MPKIQQQVEQNKLEQTRNILTQYQKLKISKSDTRKDTPKADKNVEILKEKLWKIWMDDSLEKKLKQEHKIQMAAKLKDQLPQILSALQSSRDEDLKLKVLYILIEAKLAKVNGYVTVTDRPIFYTNESGNSIQIGNLELAEIAIGKEKIYAREIRSIDKIGEIKSAELNPANEMENDKANEFLRSVLEEVG